MSTSLSSSSKFLSPSQERNFRLSLDVPSRGEKDVEKSEKDSPTKSIVWVSKEFLSIVSPVFRRMIQGDCDQKDGLSPSPEPIHLSEEKMDDFLTFLECLYPYPDQKTIDRENVFLVLLLSYKYEIRFLVEKCDKIYKEIYQAENYRVGDERILNRLSFLVKHNLIETIKMIVPYVAALDTKILEKYRLENISSIPGNHWFYLAVYEAKFQRVSDINLIPIQDPNLLILFTIRGIGTFGERGRSANKDKIKNSEAPQNDFVGKS
uniref:BTB domain-containing protein n=1 Tax=Romanomermis culicivorax TaxID=13658 RepID=A0A915JXZ8_ROMCU